MVSWDLLDEPWDSLGTWTLLGTGTSEISPAGQLHQLPNNSTYVLRQKDIGTLPEAGYTVEFRACVDSWGNGDGSYKYEFYDGLHRVEFELFADRINNPDSGTTVYVATSAGVWYVWRLVIDSDGHRLKVYRDQEYLGDLGAGLDYTFGDGTIYAATTMNPAGKVGCETHTDYLRIATGLVIPLAVSDVLGMVDSVKAPGKVVLEISDILGMVESVSKPVAFKQVVSDVLGMVESVSKPVTFKKTVSDVLGLVDSVGTKGAFKQAVSEILGMVDSAAPVRSVLITVSEVLGFRDTVETRKHVGRLGDLPDHTIQGGA